MFKVVDNFLEKEYFNEIQKTMLGGNFPWYHSYGITKEENKKDNFYFVHNFYRDFSPSSNYFNLLKFFLDKIECKSIIGIKGNTYFKTNKKEIHASHIDYPFKHKGCLLYINDNNGLTYFGKKSVKPKANRVVFFDPGKDHASSSCTDKNRRININFNYF